MNRRSGPAPLLRAIGLRLAGVATGLVAVLVAAIVLRYTADVGSLRVASLQHQADTLLAAGRSGGVAGFAIACAQHPDAYGYRIFDVHDHIISAANDTLFPLIPRYRSGRPDLTVSHRGDRPGAAQWFLTQQGTLGGRAVWVQVTMVGDPAHLWWGVVADEIFSHVVIPVAIILPGLALAVLWSLRSTLRPLGSIAQQAREISRLVSSGKPLQPLRDADLPREAVDLVGAVNALLQRTEAMLDEQKHFTANAAHELRTPLAVLSLQASRLPPSAAADRLRDDIAVMRRLVDQMLRLAQAEQLAAEGFVATDLREIGRAACEELASLATARDRLIEFDEAEKPVMVSCNPEFIGIAIRNLIENAMRATPAGTAVSVEVRADGAVVVADRGPGIPQDQRAFIFRRFWRLDRRDGQGAGIGLALVRRIIDLHGGTIAIEDRSGGGTRVVLSLTPC